MLSCFSLTILLPLEWTVAQSGSSTSDAAKTENSRTSQESSSKQKLQVVITRLGSQYNLVLPQFIEGRSYELHLTLVNKLGRDIDLGAAKGSCLCTVAKFESGRFADGAEIPTTIALVVSRNLTRFQQRLDFMDSSGTEVVASLVFSSSVVPLMSAEKSYVVASEDLKFESKINLNDLCAVDVESIKSSSNIRLLEKFLEGQAIVIKGEVDSGVRNSFFVEAIISIPYKDKEGRLLNESVPLRIERNNDVIISQSVISFKRQGNELVGQLLIKCSSQFKFPSRISSSIVDGEGVIPCAVTIKKLADRLYRLEVKAESFPVDLSSDHRFLLLLESGTTPLELPVVFFGEETER